MGMTRRDAITSIRPVPLDGVCVVIPAFNEEQLVSRCVASVLAAGLEPRQVFVIDDCSTDRTREVLAAFEGIQVIENPERLGKVRGLQRALDLYQLPERFAFIALLDADSHVDEMYFDTIVRAFNADPDAALVCGAPRSERRNWLTAFRALDYDVGSWLYKDAQDALSVIAVAPGCASVYRSSIVRSLDWSGGTLVEDMDLTIQIHRRGLGRVRYASRAISHTQDPQRLRDYVGQITRWYSGTWQVMRLRRLPRGGQRVDLEFGLLVGESLAFSLLVMLLPLLAWLWPQAVLRCLVIDQLVAASLAIVTAVRLRRLDVVLWSPTFLVIRAINCVVWVRTFWTEVVRGQSLEVWFTPQRYERRADTHVTTQAREAFCA
jgi:cellulose synthase/poly-beta-1,6-N-acetylglucosamine synthase-like glycosyltransferase